MNTRDRWQTLREMTLVEWIIIGVIVLLLLAMAIPAISHARVDQHELYNSWRKMERRTDITFEEWQALRQAGLIQQRK